MAFPTGTATPEAATGDVDINDLLGGDLDTATQPETQVAEDPSVTDQGDVAEDVTDDQPEMGDEEQATDEEETDDVSDLDEEGAEEDSDGEEDFEADTLETDFADNTYAKAAAHWAKRGVTLDPAKPADRAMLKDWLERGQKISQLQASQATDEAEAEEDAAPAAKQAPAVRTPEQMVQDRIAGVRAYAKDSFNPVVAKEIVLPGILGIAKFFWGKEAAEKALQGRSDAELAELTQSLTPLMSMAIADAIPDIVNATPGAVAAKYPYMEKMNEMAAKEDAIEQIESARDASGAELYPGFAKLVNSGAINRALASPELKGAIFSNDPNKNREAKLKVAYRLARNERVDPQVIAKAAQRGRTAEKERAARVAAGRTSPGSPTRPAANGNSSFVNTLVGNGESASSKLFKNVGRSK